MKRQALSASPPPRFRRRGTNFASAQGCRLNAMLCPAVLVAALMIVADCSAVPLDNAVAPAAPASYGVLVSEALKAYKPFAGYSDFEISGLRWLHAETGWNWLACLRYNDHGHRRIYAFFIKGNAVTNARYDIITDQCAAQQYVPFDIVTGTIGTPTTPAQQPIY
jgi:hypothetical protein